MTDLSKNEFYSGKLSVPTVQMDLLNQCLQEWSLVNLTGGFVWGYPRCGKSHALKRALPNLKTRAGDKVGSRIMQARTFTQRTDRKFWNSALLSFRHPASDVGNSIQMFSRVVSVLADEAASNAERRVVLAIDEAQNLTRFEFILLIDLTNELVARGIKPLIVLVGTVELKGRPDEYSGPSNAHIRGRFFGAKHNFRGCQSKKEIQRILGFLDKSDSALDGLSSPRLILSDSDFSGIKLLDWSDSFFQAYIEEIKILGYQEWPMHYLIEAIRVLIIDILPSATSRSERVPLVRAAIRASAIGSS